MKPSILRRLAGVLLAVPIALACQGPSPGATGSEAQPGGLRLTTPRAAHSIAVLRDGRVLFLGGCTADGCETGPGSATVDAYDPATGAVTLAGRLTAPRTGAAVAVLPDGAVLLFGGWSGSSVTDSIERFDPRSGRSRRVGSLTEARADLAVETLDDGRVLLAGGYSSLGAVGTVEVFDPATNKTEPLPLLLVPRAGAMAVNAGGGVLIVGGGTGRGSSLEPSGAAELYSLSTGSRRVGDLRVPRYKHAAAPIGGGRVAVLGGSDDRDREGKIRSIEIFDPETGLFKPGGSTVEARYKIADAVVSLPDGRVFIGGGGVRPEVYDPAGSSSSPARATEAPILNFSTAALLRDGRVLVAGGYTEDGIRVTDRVRIYRP